jgi:hypothetical protein
VGSQVLCFGWVIICYSDGILTQVLMSLSRYFPNGEPRISTIPSESNINSSRFGVKCTTPWGSHRLWHYSWVCLFPGAVLNPHPGCFKAIKKLACSEVATFLFCFFIYLGLCAKAYEPKGMCLQNH